jgi:hypothetical protein
MPSTSRVLASLTLSSLMRHQRACCFRCLDFTTAGGRVDASRSFFTALGIAACDDEEMTLGEFDGGDTLSGFSLTVSEPSSRGVAHWESAVPTPPSSPSKSELQELSVGVAAG